MLARNKNKHRPLWFGISGYVTDVICRLKDGWQFILNLTKTDLMLIRSRQKLSRLSDSSSFKNN